MKKFFSLALSSVFFLISGFIFPSFAIACTYQATITGNHLDLNITTDTNYIQFVQLMHTDDAPDAPYVVTALYGPSIYPWTQYLDGYQTYNGYSMVIQNRRQMADAAYWVSWIDPNLYLHIPAGTYGLDFTGTMTYSDIAIEYGTMDDNGIIGNVGEPWTFCERTGDVSIPTSNPTATPTPTPTPTAAPTLTPTATPTQIPVSKVVFLPGFGASWNADAILNCHPDNNPDNWSLASYATDVYNPILAALSSSGWDTKPFYYDWRQPVSTNANSLTSKINSFTIPDEKINLVGHSMGGLVERKYLEDNAGGKASSLLTIGSPHKGDALAYPAWSGGDIWDDNFLSKIATTILLRRCDSLFTNSREIVQNQIPSIHNFLPTYDYLKDTKTKVIEPEGSMTLHNSWLPTSFAAPFWGVRVGTLSGTGFDTLKTIPVKPASLRDLALGNWTDGKPSGKEKVTAGDGTVLTDSSVIEGADTNKVINQTHTGLMASVEGMTEILKFLGTSPSTLSSSFQEPNSALVIIGYPANFWITDSSGKTIKDKDGMVSYINPKSGSYKLSLLPKTGKTLFIVAQFLPNGQTLYKEYNFANYLPKFKTLKFDLQNPREDILN